MLVFLFLIDTNYVVLTLNVSEAIRQDCSSSDDTAYVVLTLGVSEKRSIRLMVERTCSVVRQNKPSWLVSARARGACVSDTSCAARPRGG